MIVKSITEYRTKRQYRTARGSDTKAIKEQYAGPCVYALSAGDRNLVKVGRTEDLLHRLRVLQVGSPTEFFIEGAVFFQKGSDVGPIEYAIHQVLDQRGMHVRGEWYKVDVGELRAIVGACLDQMEARPVRSIGRLRTRDDGTVTDEEVSFREESREACRRKSDGRVPFARM